jgi:ferredoxin
LTNGSILSDRPKLEPMSHGRADLRKKPPARIAIVTEQCSGCGGSPVCVDCCPVEACIYWIPDADHPPFGCVGIDGSTCIGCAKCAARGPDGIHLDGCPWDAIEMVPL